MSVRERKLGKINKAILLHHQEWMDAAGWVAKCRAGMKLVISMMHFEFLKNDVAIRAQSLSYFTLFSILPLIAGIFLILGFFSQWGPVQKEFEDLMAGLLSSIPGEQRTYLMSYILQFKDQFLHSARCDRIEGGAGFVHQNDFRFDSEGSGNTKALLLSA